MPDAARHVLKGNEVQLAGSLQLRMDPAATARPTAPQPDSRPVRVRIAEAHPEFAVVEVACSCGKVTHVRCEYAVGNGPAAAPQPAQG
jgi:hypothetical protein